MSTQEILDRLWAVSKAACVEIELPGDDFPGGVHTSRKKCAIALPALLDALELLHKELGDEPHRDPPEARAYLNRMRRTISDTLSTLKDKIK